MSASKSGIILVMTKNTERYYTPKQGKIPVYIAEKLNICDRVLAFDKIMEEIGIEQYLKPEKERRTGRKGYNRVNMLKTILFGFMDTGYASLRELEDRCCVNMRYMYLMDGEVPSYHTFGDFIAEELKDTAENIFRAVTEYIREKDHVDMEHVYIDGTKLEANANKYTFVWKKGTEKARYRLYEKITALLTEINHTLACYGFEIETNTEYSPESLAEIKERYIYVAGIDESKFSSGSGHRKSSEQKYCEKLRKYTDKLIEYTEKKDICGSERNSYSKTDRDATFMHMKHDHMRNDQLLPAYNIQMCIADGYIVVPDVKQYRSDMDCFVPLMDKFYELYGFYPRYPVADAGYGSFNNYLYCEEHNMEKFMKFPMYKKETTDKEYRDDPFRAVNFKTDADGSLICPNDRKLRFAYRRDIDGNMYGRQEEVYTCEDCSGCPYADKCKKGQRNRSVYLNRDLTAIHEEVLQNLNCVHGALLRMNRSIQAEGTFGILKYDRWYRRAVRKGLDSVKLEIFLVSIGHNLYKFHNNMMRLHEAA